MQAHMAECARQDLFETKVTKSLTPTVKWLAEFSRLTYKLSTSKPLLLHIVVLYHPESGGLNRSSLFQPPKVCVPTFSPKCVSCLT